MGRIAVLVAVGLLAAPAGTLAKSPTALTPLKRYLVRAEPRIDVYRGLLRRLERLLSEEPRVNVDPLVEKLRRLADRFEDSEVRWQAVNAPRGLRIRHRGMGRVFVLFADAIRIYADAVYTRHPDEIAAARPKVASRLASATYLQKRWARALRGALVRAQLRVPVWLNQMAKG